MYFLDPLNSLDCNWYNLNFYRDWGTPSWKGALTLRVFSWEPQIQGKVRGQEGVECFTPKSAPLGHKSGMSCREIKSNIYVTSTHFFCFLQDWSSCKTVIIEILQQVSIPHLPKNTMTIQYHKRRSYLLKKAYLFKLWDQTCPSLKKKKKNLKEWFWNC